MNSFQKLLVCLMLGFIALNYGCSKKNDPVGCNWATEVQDELNAQNAALDIYLADPTNSVKCQAWKDSYSDYLNALEDHIDCATLSGQQAELQSSIDAAQASLDQIQC